MPTKNEIKSYWLTEITYRARRAECAELLGIKNRSGKQNQQLYILVNKLLEMAEQQKDIYSRYLCVPRETSRFLRDIDQYKSFNNSKKSQPEDPSPHKEWPLWLSSHYIRGCFGSAGTLNQMRQVITRTHKLLLTLMPLLHDANFQLVMKIFELYFASVFAYVAWVFFLPRILINLFIMAKNVLHNDGILTPYERLKIQWGRRWQELVNNSMICTMGLLAFFVFAPTMAIPVIAAVQLCELASSLVRQHYEIEQAETLLSEDQYKDPYLEQQIDLLRENRYKDSINFAILALGACLMLTTLIAAPWVLPLLGAAIIVGVTLYRIYDLRYNDREINEKLAVDKALENHFLNNNK